jgi:hypothetical protein
MVGRRETDNLPSTSAEVRNGEAIPPVSHTSSRSGTLLIKHKDNFIYTLALVDNIAIYLLVNIMLNAYFLNTLSEFIRHFGQHFEDL